MTMTSTATTTTPSSFSKIDSNNAVGSNTPLSFEGPRALGLIPSPLTSSTPPSIPLSPVSPSAMTLDESAPPINEKLPSIEFPFAPAPLLTSSPSLVPVQSMDLSPLTPTSTTDQTSPLSPVSLELSLSPALPPPASSLSLHPFSLATLSTSYSSASSASSSSSFSIASSPNTSPSNSPTEPTSKPLISSPLQSDLTPYPARGISPEKLAEMIERGGGVGAGGDSRKGVSAGSRPLVLDLRPNPDFDPISIIHSININLPTLLMRRYRRGGAVTAFALESFITIPSDKDLYHLIQDGWKQNLDNYHNSIEKDGESKELLAHDVVVLDQDMKSGNEEFGRSPSSAWTLLSVLERGGGGCSGPIRLWYLEGGFEAFQAWDIGEKYLMRPGCAFEMNVTQDSPVFQKDQDVEMTLAEGAETTEENGGNGGIGGNSKGNVRRLSLALPSGSSSSTSSTITDSRTAQAIENAVSLTTASLNSNPRRGAGGPPARRESLFSLNTKSLQRPARLARSQTVGVSALNIKPLSIPPPPMPMSLSSMQLHPLQEGPNGGDQQPGSLSRKGSWLTVPNAGTPVLQPQQAVSPIMSLNNSSMEIAHSASSEGPSTYSSGIGGGDQQQQMLNPKKSFSSASFLSSNSNGNYQQGIQEENEEEGKDDSLPVHPFQMTSSSSSLSTNSSNLRRHHSGGAFVYPTSPAPGATFFDSNGSQEYNSRMFADGIDSYSNNFNSQQLYYQQQQQLYQQQQQQQGYSDEYSEDGEIEGEQEISCILANFLFLGPEIATMDQVQELEKLGIKRVLNMARECEDLLVQNRPGMEYHKVGVQDHIEADVTTGLLEAVDIIATNDSPIYVHCKAGKSRSVTVIIAYLITQLQWSLNKAYSHVLAQRPCMCPNIGFVTELMRMEEKTLGNERAGGLARAGF
ncbi:hypothetical protein BGZ46_000374 [Entomortierella lignicola]|nr:hypothetical protein BGZ46_000374 [Entomortierella lignicola]